MTTSMGRTTIANLIQWPADALDHECPGCAAPLAVRTRDDQQPALDVYDTGRAAAHLVCTAECGNPGQMLGWPLTTDDYRTLFGTPGPTLILGDDTPDQPVPPEQRTLPPGPWGVKGVEPVDIPADAWEQQCPNKTGRHRDQVCGAALYPDPAGVFYYDEFTSRAILGMACRGGCAHVLAHYTWQLTDEQHQQVFGRTLAEFNPAADYDPDDPDDSPVEYSMWDTADRSNLTHFATFADIAEAEMTDWRTTTAGTLTVRHWATGVEWDGAEFYLAHQQDIDNTYDGVNDSDDLGDLGDLGDEDVI